MQANYLGSFTAIALCLSTVSCCSFSLCADSLFSLCCDVPNTEFRNFERRTLRVEVVEHLNS